MKIRFTLILISLILLIGVAGCGPRVPTDIDSLAAVLENTGATVTVGDPGEQAWLFAVPSRSLTFDSNHLSVFEFPDAGIARTEADRVWPDGFSLEPTPIWEGSQIKQGDHVDWIGPPHYFLSGKLIVVYVGDDPQVYSFLTDILGAQFAGSPAP